jgi:rod shape determining protein RodA
MSLLGLQFGVLKRMNGVMLLAMLALVVIGVLFIRSACAARQELVIRDLYRMQIIWAAAGFGVFVLTSLLDYRRLSDGVWLYYASAIVLLVMVLVVGTELYGSRRWLNFFGMNLQPSEVGKLALLLAVAWYLSRPGVDVTRWQTLGIVFALTGVPLILILKEPDLGTAIVCLPIVISMLYAGGASLKHFGILALSGGLVVAFLFGAILVPRAMGMTEDAQKAVFTRVTRLKEYQWKRLVVFVDPASDRKGAGYNSWQSAIAVGSGGLTGKGYMRGTQSSLGYLPRTVASTDFIFAVIAEEMGFAGGVVVLGLFAVIIACGMRAAARARDKMGRLICTGVTAMVFAHVFVNIAMTIGAMPITGIPLPLISYGGSFMLCTMASLGLLQSVYGRRI